MACKYALWIFHKTSYNIFLLPLLINELNKILDTFILHFSESHNLEHLQKYYLITCTPLK